MPAKAPPQTVLTLLIGLVCFVAVPALVTAVAPVSYVRFEKRDGHVAASVSQCLLFVIPYSQSTIEPVKGFEERVIASRTRMPTAHERRQNKDHNVTVEGEATLIIIGEDEQSVSVRVSPVNIHDVKERAEKFLKEPTDTPLSLFVVANWKFSVLVGGVLSLLTILYIGGSICAFFVWLTGVIMPRGTNDASSFGES